MEAIASALLELYMPLALGMAYAALARPDESFARSLSRAVLYSFLPLLLFSSVYRRQPGGLAKDFVAVAVTAAAVIAASLSSSYLLTGGDRELMLLSTYVNAGYLPIPIAYVMWGADALPLVGFYILVNASVGYTLAPLLLTGRIRRGLTALAKYPPLYAILAGLLLSLAGVKLPNALLTPISRVGSAAPYIALFVLGVQAFEAGVKLDADSLRVMATRFLIAPLVAFLVAPAYAEPGGLAYRVLMLEASMPPAVTNVVLANVYGQHPERVAKVVFTLTLLAALSTPLILALLA
ncbi:MAG: hypothetical protein DRJ96_06035 [Thermoprotei archaeon]|nr:AEC family transporter [Thermoproteales archaeon]RLE88952.1 MAG: hypothetical protein DRJ67_00570 [Thermoprotei archaeon]RLE96630.1 MAG: hypothetical protein DRJ96_06035 [Thermoprotei archaeon]